MKLSASVANYLMECEVLPESRRWYRQKLTHFSRWVSQQGVHDSEELEWGLVACFIESLRASPSARSGKPA